jgi:hypothetical protein
VRFMVLAIFLTGDLLRECAFSSRTSAFDQERRLARLPCLFAITYLLRHNWGTDNGQARASRVELVASSLSDLEVLQADFSSKAADHWVFGPHMRLLDSQRPVAFVQRLHDCAATSAWVAKSVFNLVLRPIRQLGINGR